MQSLLQEEAIGTGTKLSLQTECSIIYIRHPWLPVVQSLLRGTGHLYLCVEILVGSYLFSHVKQETDITKIPRILFVRFIDVVCKAA